MRRFLVDRVLGQRTHYLPVMPPDEFPDLPEPIDCPHAADDLLPAYRKVSTFASGDPTRHVLNGAALDAEDPDNPRMVGTDGRRLIALPLAGTPFTETLVVPVHKFLLWTRLPDACRLGVKGNRMRFEIGPWTLDLRLIEGTFPSTL